MLKRLKQATEAIGLTAPALPDAQAAAERAGAELVHAERAVESAENTLQAQHDAGATEKELAAGEARLADARITLGRAQRAYQASQKRLEKARTLAAERDLEAGYAELRGILAKREAAAQRIDGAAEAIGAARLEILALDEQIAGLRAKGVGDRSVMLGGPRIARAIELSLMRHQAIEKQWLGPITEVPMAADLIANDSRVLLLAEEPAHDH